MGIFLRRRWELRARMHSWAATAAINWIRTYLAVLQVDADNISLSRLWDDEYRHLHARRQLGADGRSIPGGHQAHIRRGLTPLG